MTLDPATNAVRADLADIRLAGQVFASHFAAAVPYRAVRSVPVIAKPGTMTVVTQLDLGDRFDVLELTEGFAWGVAPGPSLVGYVDLDALEVQP